MTNPVATTTYDDHLGTIIDHLGSWATIELIRGLLASDGVLQQLEVGATVADLAVVGGASERQVRSLLLSLEVEDVVCRDGELWKLSAFGSGLRERRGWIEMVVNGYGGYFRQSERLWRGQVDPAWRDMRAVGQGSVAISRHGALPLVIELMRELKPEGRRIVDVGCANADYLIALCEGRDDLIGVGVEPAPDLREDARQRIQAAGLEHRVEIIGSVDDINFAMDEKPDFFVFGFVLHELIEQRGQPWLEAFLHGIGRDYPEAWVLAVEADASARENVERMRAERHLRGYYNPYYLLHDFTDQRLLTGDEWRGLFDASGLEVHDVRPISPTFDPTGQEIAFAVRAR